MIWLCTVQCVADNFVKKLYNSKVEVTRRGRPYYKWKYAMKELIRVRDISEENAREMICDGGQWKRFVYEVND